MRFTEDTDRIFEDKLQKRRTGHFTEKDSGNRKQRLKAWELQTEARAYTADENVTIVDMNW